MNEEEFITKFYSCDDEEQFLKDVNHNLNCLQQENKRLKDNWNKLKKQEIDRFNESQDVQFLDVLQDMQELEQGSDSNVKDKSI